MTTHMINRKKRSLPAGFVRQTILSDKLEGIVTIPKSLKHRMVEVILLPLDTEQPIRRRIDKTDSSPLVLFAGAWAGEVLVREDQGLYETREEFK
ncbi:MAG: hypothetical protein A2075_06375 [Geobacteraceae bacterium GWC2_58_44]|nr:MAG: hypothetical protein A2075_06375 [Geobacteraceae bacterium GWC2_58_44]